MAREATANSLDWPPVGLPSDSNQIRDGKRGYVQQLRFASDTRLILTPI